MKKYFSSKFIFPWIYNPWSPRRTSLRTSPELLVVGGGEVFSGAGLVRNCAELDNFGRTRPTKTAPISKMKPCATMKKKYVQVHSLKKLWWNFQLNRSPWVFLPLKPFVPNLAWEHLHPWGCVYLWLTVHEKSPGSCNKIILGSKFRRKYAAGGNICFRIKPRAKPFKIR